MKIFQKLCFTSGIVIAGVLSCADDADFVYSSLRAFFRFEPVTAAPSTLQPALNSPGEWCFVTVSGSYYNFKSATGKTDTYPKSQLAQYGTTIWVNGLLVGTPNVPDILTGLLSPVCYDSACPNCYEQGGIKRNITISDISLGQATCSRCQHIYDLENSGVCIGGKSEGEKAPKLYRYHFSYNNNTFVVQN